ncbi:hypothetical protein AB4559_19935 [Vibrio sp. 10N.222.51.C8]|uniref:hypothetical protein n=2 Tax=Vibrio TaxID=662 RepID=UPI001055F665|nr:MULTISPECIES: hypothetical protein [unclassified Vibrio]TKF77209.1 hypothetical protein FCV59_01175 [Vibrio sp. F13]TKF92573.1 hypothetical protein FCV73_05565 [Vibrio sp. F13]TKG11559.1 hypothetical protein FCV67_02245 [Vibrio sp. F13]
MRLHYTLTTLQPIIVSQNSATTMNHLGLDYIPGSAILGTVASTLYQQVSDAQSWALFHSGEVKYSACYPVCNGELCLPTPASWHYQKMETPVSDGKYDTSKITNHASRLFERKAVQYKQCRNGYLGSQGHLGEVRKGNVTKTALQRTTGAVKEGSLFSYVYIEAGQTFSGWVECGTEQYYALVKQHLLGTKRVGRSRSAEFGRVDIAEIKAPVQSPPSHKASHNSQQLVLWCLSDCQVFTQNGLPTYTPSLADLIEGANGQLNPERSFIRTHSVSRFNQARQGLDSEQLLIGKGSVLVFEDVSITTNQIEQLQQNGIGLNLQQGLGWVDVNPSWAERPELNEDLLFSPIVVESSSNQSSLVSVEVVDVEKTEVTTPLTRWAKTKLDQTTQGHSCRRQANELIREILQVYSRCRSYNHVKASCAIGPSRTQWGRVHAAIRNKTPDWFDILFEDMNNKLSRAICKPVNDAQGWGVAWQVGNTLVTFADYFKALVSPEKIQIETLLLALERMSRYDMSTDNGLKKATQSLICPKGTNDE